MKQFKGLLIGLAIGAVLMIVGIFDSNDALYRPHWNETVGEVVATGPVGANTSDSLTRIIVRYTTAAGTTLEMPREFDLNAHPQFNVGNLVTVLYNEPNPLQHFIRVPNPPQDMLALAAIAGGAAIVLGSLVFEAQKQIKQRRIPTAA